jgi:hypothetical protein
MPDYDFSTLSPRDFEDISRDLLQKELDVHLESFRSGRDQGIDLRYSIPGDKTNLVIQAKHYARSGFNKLKSHLKNKELPKLAKLKTKPSRYILTTSVSFTPNRKNELFDILKPYCKSQGDIFGLDDLNNLLGKYSDVEQNHFKLWLPSTAVLERLLHNRVFSQSALELDEIKRLISLFATTDALHRGRELLNDIGFCMLTGIPGIGKTTTARMLVAQHVHKNWEAVYLTGDAGEALEVFNATKQQIFFYDDFLGLTSLGEQQLGKNEDKELLQLIKACNSNPTKKRLILTTRDYLYEQARRRNELLSRETGIETGKATVKVEDYTNPIRAEILVNHLYFYGVPAEVCSDFVSSGKAKESLFHPNYSPRIVETMCRMHKSFMKRPNQFEEQFIETLNSPSTIWEHAFRNQLTDKARELLLVFATHEGTITLEALKHHFRLYCKHVGLAPIGFDPFFLGLLKELEGTFLSVENGDPHFVKYHNPGIKDFTDRELQRDGHFLRLALNSFTYSSVLTSVAKKLVKSHPFDFDEHEVFEACKRADSDTAYRGKAVPSRRTQLHRLDISDSSVDSLLEWLLIISTFSDSDLKTTFLEQTETFLSGLNPENELESTIKLHDSYVQLCKILNRDHNVTHDELWEILLPHAYSPEDFVELNEFTSSLKDEAAADEELCNKFVESYEEWLEDSVSDAGSSSQYTEAFDAVLYAASALGLADSEFDFSDYDEEFERIQSQEEAKADGDIEGWKFERASERAEERDVDDILDSMRE